MKMTTTSTQPPPSALHAVEKFLATGIEDAVRTAGVNEAVAFLKRKAVLESAAAMLDCLCTDGAALVRGKLSIPRVFVAAYAIHFHLSGVFSYIGPGELRVIRSARAVLDAFNELVLAIRAKKSFSKVPAGMALRLSSGLNEYIENFQVWEVREKIPRVHMVRFTLVSLYFTYFYHSKEQDARLRGVIRTQMLDLREKCVEKYGAGVLEALDADLAAGKFGMPPIRTPGQLELLDADPTFFLLRTVDHAQMVHELYTDVNYRPDWTTLKESPIHAHVTLARDDGLHWSTILADLLCCPQVLTSLLDNFLDFKRMVLRVVDDGLKGWVEESFGAGAEDGWDGCVARVRAIMVVACRIQMPVRSRETEAGMLAFEAIDSPEAMVACIKCVYHCLKTAELDYHGLKILLVSRVLSENAGVYLAGRFKDMLDRGVITMGRTRAWIASSVKDCVQRMSENALKDFKPLNTLGAKKVLFMGLQQLLFGKKLLRNEHDFPETYLYDVWRMCSLQRKLRIDASALCAMAGLRQLLTSLKLLDTPNGKLALARVNQLYLAVDYGTRGPSDFSDDDSVLPSNSTLPSQLRDELAVLFPDQGRGIASKLSACFNLHGRAYTKVFDGIADMMKRPPSGVGAWSAFAESECAVIVSRSRKNIAAIQRAYAVNASVHLNSCLQRFIAEEVAKLE